MRAWMMQWTDQSSQINLGTAHRATLYLPGLSIGVFTLAHIYRNADATRVETSFHLAECERLDCPPENLRFQICFKGTQVLKAPCVKMIHSQGQAATEHDWLNLSCLFLF